MYDVFVHAICGYVAVPFSPRDKNLSKKNIKMKLLNLYKFIWEKILNILYILVSNELD